MCRPDFSKWPLYSSKPQYSKGIGLDVDGVLINIDEVVNQFVTDYYPLAKLVNPSAWSYSKRYDSVPGDIDRYLFEERARDLYARAKPYPGAIEFYKKLRKLAQRHKWELVLVTQKNNVSIYAMLDWFKKHSIWPDKLLTILFQSLA